MSRRAAALGFICTLGIVEALCRGPALFRLGLGDGVSLLHRKAAWLREGPQAALLVVGDSTGQQGIDAAALGGGVDLETKNVAFPSGSPIVVRALLEGQAPRMVLFTLSPLLLSDGWAAEPPEVDVATPWERVRLVGAGPGLLGSLWATYLRRRTLAGAGKAAVRRLLGQPPSDGSLRDFGRLRGASLIEDGSGSLAVQAPPEVGEAQAAALLRAWAGAGGPRAGVRLSALEALAARWRRSGVAVVYVLMPLHSTLRAALQRDAASRSFQRLALAALTRRHGGRVLDCEASVPDSGFHDPDHLRAGPLRDAFSRRLGEALRARAERCPVIELAPGR